MGDGCGDIDKKKTMMLVSFEGIIVFFLCTLPVLECFGHVEIK